MSKSGLVERVFRKLYAEQEGCEPDVPRAPAEFLYRPPAGVVRPASESAAEWFDLITAGPIRVVRQGGETDGRPVAAVPVRTALAGPVRVKLGSGGLHIIDTKALYRATDEWELWSADVSSYYPSFITTKGFFPRQYGEIGAEAYRAILDRRLEVKDTMKTAATRAERRRLDVEQYGLKIVINSTFGKFGSIHSSLFDLGAMLGVSLSDQLMLVNLIERLDQVGAEVLSANTDSVTFRTRRGDKRWRQVLADWEHDTAMVMDVNSLDTVLLLGTNIYATRDLKGKIKRRGAGLKGNPDPEKALNSPVVADAVVSALFDGIPPETTVVAEQNLARFCAVVRTSSKVAEAVLVDDATGRETPLGKITRWYKAVGSKLRIVHRMISGKETTPAKATGITLAQDLTDATIPPDLDLDHYIAEARKAVNAVSGDHRLNPSLIPDHGPARGALDRGLVPFPLLDVLKLRFFATCVGGGFPPFCGFGQNGGDEGDHSPNAEEGASRADHAACTPTVQVVSQARLPEAASPTIGSSLRDRLPHAFGQDVSLPCCRCGSNRREASRSSQSIPGTPLLAAMRSPRPIACPTARTGSAAREVPLRHRSNLLEPAR